jgi:cyclase
VPLTAGGWVTSVEEARGLLRLGADKIVINTEAVRRPAFITECATVFGSQCVVISIDVRREGRGEPEVFINRGAESTGQHPVAWAQEAQRRGAGEIFLTSIDREGLQQGYDVALLREVSAAVDIPVVAFGGAFAWSHLMEGLQAGVDAVAAANVFHYTEHSTKRAKEFLRARGADVR